MSISGVSASTTTQQLQRPPGPGKEIRQGIDNLKNAIESGDLDATKAAYESLSKLQSDKQNGASSTSSTSQRKDPLSNLLSSVGEALESGDISQVQAAFEAAGPKGPGGVGGGVGGGRGGPPPGGGGAGGPPPDGGGPSEEVVSAFGSFAQSLQSGDLTSAQSSYSALTDLLKSSAEDDGSDSSSSSSTSSTSSSSSTSATDRFSSVLSDIGTALQAGNLSSAQKLFASLAPRGSQGVDVYA